MKLLLLGASGLVGSAVARQAAAAGYEVTGTVSGWAGGVIAGVTKQVKIDLTAVDAVALLTRASAATVIVNAGAIAEPAICENEPVRSHRMNVDLPSQLADLAHEIGARLIHLSSDQVFDGTAAPYSVGDPVRGINLYARQKIESELRVHATNPTALTLRLPLLLGNSPSGRRSLHERLLAQWSAGREARLYIDEIRQPCTANSVAQVILEIIPKPEMTGVFHWAGADPISRFEIGLRIRQRFGLSAEWARIVAVERKSDPLALTDRQANLSLILSPLTMYLATRPQTITEALTELGMPTWWDSRRFGK
ncbi:MAG: sugar nucleotide-binding protein [bacterium]|nr:sugar nucleotide-binding protein [bacterium]